MLPDPLLEELRTLAVEINALKSEDVSDAAAVLVKQYRTKADIIRCLDGIDRMTGMAAVEVQLHERLTRARAELRDSLRALLEWAKVSGRV